MQTIQNKTIKLLKALNKSIEECESFNLVCLLLWMNFIFCIVPPLFCCICDYFILQYFNFDAFCILILTFLPWQFPLMCERFSNREIIWNTLITLTTYMASIIMMFFTPWRCKSIFYYYHSSIPSLFLTTSPISFYNHHLYQSTNSIQSIYIKKHLDFPSPYAFCYNLRYFNFIKYPAQYMIHVINPIFVPK